MNAHELACLHETRGAGPAGDWSNSGGNWSIQCKVDRNTRDGLLIGRDKRVVA